MLFCFRNKAIVEEASQRYYRRQGINKSHVGWSAVAWSSCRVLRTSIIQCVILTSTIRWTDTLFSNRFPHVEPNRKVKVNGYRANWYSSNALGLYLQKSLLSFSWFPPVSSDERCGRSFWYVTTVSVLNLAHSSWSRFTAHCMKCGKQCNPNTNRSLSFVMQYEAMGGCWAPRSRVLIEEPVATQVVK
jgi:hypothetical protein